MGLRVDRFPHLLLRRTIEEPRMIGTMADRLHLGQVVAGVRAIQDMPIGVHDRRDVICTLDTTLDLDAVNPRRFEIVEMLEHHEVLGVHDVGAMAVFLDRKVLAGAFLLLEHVVPSARLGAVPPVGIAPGEIRADQATTRIGHAHGPVDEDLELEVAWDARAYGGDLRQRELPRKDDASRAELIPLQRGEMVGT